MVTVGTRKGDFEGQYRRVPISFPETQKTGGVYCENPRVQRVQQSGETFNRRSPYEPLRKSSCSEIDRLELH